MKKVLLGMFFLAVSSACSLDKELIYLGPSDSDIIANAVVNAGIKVNSGLFSSLSEATGVAKNDGGGVTGTGQNVRTIYNNNKSVLPENIIDSIKQGSATQLLAIVKISSAFCDRLTNGANNTKRAAIFPSVNFALPSGAQPNATQLSNAAQVNPVVDALFSEFLRGHSPTAEDYLGALDVVQTIASGETESANLTRSKAFHLCTAVASRFEFLVI